MKLNRKNTPTPITKANMKKVIDLFVNLNNLDIHSIETNIAIDRFVISVESGSLPDSVLIDIFNNTESTQLNLFNELEAMNNKVSNNLAKVLTEADINFVPNLSSEFIDKNVANLITEITKDKMDNIRSALTFLHTEGISPQYGKDYLKGNIGLRTSVQEGNQKKFTRLITKYQKQYKDEFSDYKIRAERSARIDLKVIEKKALQYRHETISITELTRMKGDNEIQQMNALLASNTSLDITKTWRKGGTTDHWDSSNLYDGKTIAYNIGFDTLGLPEYTVMTPPFMTPKEIRDRCYCEYDINKKNRS